MEKHEYETILLFTELGVDVELVPRSRIKGVQAPDIIINGIEWEIKSPIGKGKYLMANTIQKAVKQSRNVIIDLRRTKRHQRKCLDEIKREFDRSKSLERIKIITKGGKILHKFKHILDFPAINQ